MLIPNSNSKFCKYHEDLDGDCCCNCRYRYTIVTNGVPVGYVCYHPDLEYAMRLRYDGHEMCECHNRVGEKYISELEIE